MSAAVATAAPRGDRTPRFNASRVSLSDIIIIAVAVLAVVAGWGIKGWHDNQVHTAEVAGATVAYPKTWLRLPAVEPMLLNAIATDGSGEKVIFTAADTAQTDLLLAVATGSANPSGAEQAYTQIANEETTVDGVPAIRTEYAYVETKVGAASVPTVMRGYQYAWLKDGKLYALSFEAPEDEWDDATGKFERLVDDVEI